MFVYKTQKQLGEMDESAIDIYMVAKKTHEDAERKKEIEDAVNAVKADLEKKVSDAEKKADDATEQIGKLKEQTEKGEEQKEGSLVTLVKGRIKDGNYEKASFSEKVEIKAAALMTTANVTPNVAGGFSPLFGNYIDQEIGHVPKPDPIFMSLVTVKNQPGTESIWYVDRVNEEGDAEFIAEGALKPLADAEWKTSKAAIKEVALRWKQTRRLILHAPSVIADFAEHANELIEQKIDDKILEGNETTTPTEFDGLATVASAFVAPAALAGYYAFANIYDVIMAMATQVRLANFKGKITAVLNTVWMAQMAGVKDSQGRYIIPPFVSPDGKNVGEVQVVFSNKMPAADILVGDLKKYNLVIAENVEYFEGYENDDFSKNLVSKKLEAFMGSYIKDSDAGSIVYDDIASVLTDIESTGIVVTP
jgi:HK97 family phage major capsid protein